MSNTYKSPENKTPDQLADLDHNRSNAIKIAVSLLAAVGVIALVERTIGRDSDNEDSATAATIVATDPLTGVDEESIFICVTDEGEVTLETPRLLVDKTTDVCYGLVEDTNLPPSPEVSQALHSYVWAELHSDI